MRVAFFGGSFNPPHLGHAMAVSYALGAGLTDQVLVVPVFAHAFGKVLAPFDHRFRMAELAMGGISGVTVCSIEANLPSPSRTLTTLRHLTRVRPFDRFQLLIGGDQLADLDKWYGAAEVRAMAPLLVLGRVGVSLGEESPPPVLPGFSSTRVRELLKSGGGQKELEASVPRKVLAYIEEHALYKSSE